MAEAPAVEDVDVVVDAEGFVVMDEVDDEIEVWLAGFPD